VPERVRAFDRSFSFFVRLMSRPFDFFLFVRLICFSSCGGLLGDNKEE
jgi:hypothetical protein